MAKWIQKMNLKEGALHRQLGVPEGQKMPQGVMSSIANAKVGSTVSMMGKKIRVTGLLKSRVLAARNMNKGKA